MHIHILKILRLELKHELELHRTISSTTAFNARYGWGSFNFNPFQTIKRFMRPNKKHSNYVSAKEAENMNGESHRPPQFTDFKQIYILTLRGDFETARELLNENMANINQRFGIIVKDQTKKSDSTATFNPETYNNFIGKTTQLMILIVVTFCLSNFMIYRLSKNLKEQINLHNIRSETKTRIEGLKELSFNDFLQRIFVYGRAEKFVYYPEFEKALVLLAPITSLNNKEKIPVTPTKTSASPQPQIAELGRGGGLIAVECTSALEAAKDQNLDDEYILREKLANLPIEVVQTDIDIMPLAQLFSLIPAFMVLGAASICSVILLRDSIYFRWALKRILSSKKSSSNKARS